MWRQLSTIAAADPIAAGLVVATEGFVAAVVIVAAGAGAAGLVVERLTFVAAAASSDFAAAAAVSDAPFPPSPLSFAS